jgi:ABC-2 type transport system permease protein
MHVDGWDGNLSAERQAQAFAVSQVAPMFPLYIIMLLVLTFYLLDCLYAERKDRSILFWKSLPVSDGLTVLSKFLVAVVVVPLGVLVLAAVCHVLLFVVWQLGVATGRLPDVLTWSTMMWLKVEGVMLGSLLLGALWYAPVAASFLLVSAWARRSPIMWVTLAPIVAMVVEWKFGTHYVATFLNYRSFGIWEVLGTGHGERLEHGARLEAVLGDLNFAAAFTNLNLWLGVAATAALLYATVRVRRYRDDT